MDVEKGANFLRDMSDILDEIGLEHFVGFGTLLGIYRDKQLIPYDKDIDLCTLDPKGKGKVKKALESGLFAKKGIRAFKGRAFTFERDGISLDIYFFKRHKAHIFNCGRYQFSEQQTPFIEIEFNGKFYKAPNDIERYLEVRYGPKWKTPKRGAHAQR